MNIVYKSRDNKAGIKDAVKISVKAISIFNEKETFPSLVFTLTGGARQEYPRESL